MPSVTFVATETKQDDQVSASAPSPRARYRWREEFTASLPVGHLTTIDVRHNQFRHADRGKVCNAGKNDRLGGSASGCHGGRVLLVVAGRSRRRNLVLGGPPLPRRVVRAPPRARRRAPPAAPRAPPARARRRRFRRPRRRPLSLPPRPRRQWRSQRVPRRAHRPLSLPSPALVPRSGGPSSWAASS